MAKEMLINTVAGQECRIAILADGRLEELYVERVSQVSRVGNIYKGRITNVEPAIQAAFVDFGAGKNGFLHISDLHPRYFPEGKKSAEQIGRRQSRRVRPPIQDCLTRGAEVIVQITKEGIGTKGPTLTTYLSIPGRLLVMMPHLSRLGVSRKIEDEEARAKTRTILEQLSIPKDMGFIARTVGVGRSKRDFQRDLSYLLRLWKAVEQRIKSSKTPAEIYQESDLVTRTIRDTYNSDISRVICDDNSVARKVSEFLAMSMPRTKHNIQMYTGAGGLFHDYGLEDEIEKVYSRRVELPLGGSLVIDQTEALVAIDINSGRFRAHDNAETTSLKINLQAAVEIARQLRLRDMGGVIVIDFIDMYQSKNQREVERTLKAEIKKDRARTKILRMSGFCIVEMTRQRVRPSLKDSLYSFCKCCQGTGQVKSDESLALMVMRLLQRAASNEDVASVEVRVRPEVAHHLTNYERQQIYDLETDSGKTIIIRSDADLTDDDVKISCTNQRGSSVAWEHPTTGEGKEKPRLVSFEKHKSQLASKKTKAQPQAPPEAAPVPKTRKKRKSKKNGRPARKSETPGKDKPKPQQVDKPDARSGRKSKVESDAEAKAQVQSKSESAPATAKSSSDQPKKKRKTRRGKRGGRKHKKKATNAAESDS